MRIFARILAFFIVSISCCANAEQPTPKVPSDKTLGFLQDNRTEIINTLKRVGLTPVKLPEVFNEREDVRRTLQELVTRYLIQAGIEVLPPETYATVYDRLNLQLGGIYDANTGEIKPELYTTLTHKVMREIVEKEHLNGTVHISVRASTAEYLYDKANVHGAIEYSFGHPEPNGLANMFADAPNNKGVLSSWSVFIQIINTQNQVVFNRFGGIQLASYYDPAKTKGALTGFLNVPATALLRDRTRLERAVRLAIDPLLKTPEQIVNEYYDLKISPLLIQPDALPLPPEGVKEQPESPFMVRRDQILRNTHTVILAPINRNNFVATAETLNRFHTLIRAELASLGWTLIESTPAHETEFNDLIKNGKLYNPLNGKFDKARDTAIRQQIALSISANADAVLWPTFIRVDAPHKGGNAKWDGASQNIYNLGPVKKANFWETPLDRNEAYIDALSLQLQLRTADDSIIYHARGGIQLLQQQQDDKEVDLAPSALFQDPSRDAIAIHAALRHLVVAPDELDKELNPSKYKNAKHSEKHH